MRFTSAAIVTMSVLMTTVSCATKTQTGAVIGAGGGAVVGAVIGRAAGNTAAGTIIGAAVGGAAGAIIGNYMDRQAAEMERDLEGARIERIGEGIKITFAGGILFPAISDWAGSIRARTSRAQVISSRLPRIEAAAASARPCSRSRRARRWRGLC
mgnify:CR=1 FL=1